MLSIAQQIIAANTKPKVSVSDAVAGKEKGLPRGNYGTKDMRHVYMARVKKCREEYRAIMFDPGKKEQSWMTSSKIEMKAGKARSGSYDVIQNMVSEGLVEKRPAGGGPYNRRKGWEYRWIGE